MATYTLKHSLTVKLSAAAGDREETISEVTIRRPTGNDLLLMDEHQGKPMLLTLEMIARLGDLTSAQVRRLDAEDIGPLGELAMSAVGIGQQTGETA